ncbi:MAG: tripartite tricarboxylate transporter substrate binding protein [Betaproteobacteria bacterium]|nr:tripartite tricarboxylate transporter substrate binding protein [Betaproteobacteria bacterium]
MPPYGKSSGRYVAGVWLPGAKRYGADRLPGQASQAVGWISSRRRHRCICPGTGPRPVHSTGTAFCDRQQSWRRGRDRQPGHAANGCRWLRPYGPQDFTPIAHIASIGIVLVAHPSAPYNTVAELINYAKVHPGQLNYASGGNGVTNHLAMELLKSRTGVNITHIPYRGSAPALQDVIAGQVPLMFDSIAASGPHIRTGKVKALGIAGLSRSEALPGVPTMTESSAAVELKGFDTPGWIALYAPKGLPPAITQRLQDAVAKVLESPEAAQRFASAGAVPRYLGSAALTAYEETEIKKWGEAIRFSGARID